MFQMLNSHPRLAAPVGEPTSRDSQAQPCSASSWASHRTATSYVYERFVRHHQLSRAICNSLQDPTQRLTLMVLDGLSNTPHSQDHCPHAYRHQKIWGRKESFPWWGKSCASGRAPVGPSPNGASDLSSRGRGSTYTATRALAG